MAGPILYNGEMFQAMIDKLDQTIISINNVNTAVSQGVKALMIGASDTVQVNAGNPAATQSSADYNDDKRTVIYKFKAYADGSMKVKWAARATRQSAAGSATVEVQLSVTSGTGKNVSIGSSAIMQDYVGEIVVANGATVEIALHTRGVNGAAGQIGCSGWVDANSIKMCFDIINIVDNKGIIPLSI